MVKLWDFASGEQKRTIGGSAKGITSFQFLDAVPEALVSSGDNQVRLVREDGNNVRGFGGASDFTQAAAITPDGRWVAAGGTDAVLRIWNGQNGELIRTFNPPERRNPLKLANAPVK